jgi:hypothetical protein
MFDLINALIHLPPEISLVSLALLGIILYNTYRLEWKIQMIMVVISTEKHDRKTGAIPYEAFKKYGLTDGRRMLP